MKMQEQGTWCGVSVGKAGGGVEAYRGRSKTTLISNPQGGGGGGSFGWERGVCGTISWDEGVKR
jgi:hypothetical protein